MNLIVPISEIIDFNVMGAKYALLKNGQVLEVLNSNDELEKFAATLPAPEQFMSFDDEKIISNEKVYYYGDLSGVYSLKGLNGTYICIQQCGRKIAFLMVKMSAIELDRAVGAMTGRIKMLS